MQKIETNNIIFAIKNNILRQMISSNTLLTRQQRDNTDLVFPHILNPIKFEIDKTNCFAIELKNQDRIKYQIAVTISPAHSIELFIENMHTNKRLTTQCNVYMQYKYSSNNIHCKYFGNMKYEKINYTKIIRECSCETKDADEDGEIIYMLNQNSKYLICIKNTTPVYLDIQNNYVLLYI